MGWVRNLFELFEEGPSSRATAKAYGQVREGNSAVVPAPSPPGTAYVQLWLQEMWLAKDREWLNNYAPIVQSSLKFQFDSKDVAFPATAGQIELGDGRELKNLEDAIQLNYPLSPPIPYNGGAIEFAIALMRKRTYDGLNGIIGSVAELAKALKVAQLSSVIDLISPITSTIDSVFGLGDEYSLGAHDSFSSDENHPKPVQPGYFVAINIPASQTLMNQLQIINGRLHWTHGEPFREADYLLLRVGVTSTRSDLRQISEIFDSLEEAVRSGVAENPDNARAFLQKACLAALYSPDLTEADRNRLPAALHAEYKSKVQAVGGAGDGAGAPFGGPTKAEDVLDQTDPTEARATPRQEVLDAILSF